METTKTFTQVRQAKNGAFGWIVSILGEDYLQKGTKAEAYDSADKINERCAGMTIGEVREYYKLGNYQKFDAESIAIAQRLGNGNVSEGIRKALKQVGS